MQVWRKLILACLLITQSEGYLHTLRLPMRFIAGDLGSLDIRVL